MSYTGTPWQIRTGDELPARRVRYHYRLAEATIMSMAVVE